MHTVSCKICLSEDNLGEYEANAKEKLDDKELDEKIVAPCACRGSFKWLHFSCLVELETHKLDSEGSRLFECGVCKQPYVGQVASLLIKRLLQEAEQKFDKDDMVIWNLKDVSMRVFMEAGYFDECEKLGRELVDHWLQKAGSKEKINSNTLQSMSMLANVLAKQNKLEEAEELHVAALKGYENTLGSDHLDTYDCINDLANVFYAQFRLNKAEEYYNRALDGYKKKIGSLGVETLNSKHNLASVYCDQYNLEGSEKLLREALEGYEKVLGPEHPGTLNCINSLVNVLYKRRSLEKAKALALDVLSKNEKILGPENPGTLASMQNLANLYTEEANYTRAALLHRLCLSGFKNAFGEEHPSTWDSMNDLAILLTKQQKLDEAEDLCRKSLIGYCSTVGSNHPYALNNVTHLAHILEERGDLEQAEKLYRQSIEGCKNKLGSEHPQTCESLSNLGTLLSNQGRLIEAEPLLNTALKGMKDTLFEGHPNIFICMNSLANLLVRQISNGIIPKEYRFSVNPLIEALTDAKKYYIRTIKACEEHLGPSHFQTLEAVHDFAAEYFIYLGNYKRARIYLIRAHGGRNKIFGSEHKKTQASWYLLQECDKCSAEGSPISDTIASLSSPISIHQYSSPGVKTQRESYGSQFSDMSVDDDSGSLCTQSLPLKRISAPASSQSTSTPIRLSSNGKTVSDTPLTSRPRSVSHNVASNGKKRSTIKSKGHLKDASSPMSIESYTDKKTSPRSNRLIKHQRIHSPIHKMNDDQSVEEEVDFSLVRGSKNDENLIIPIIPQFDDDYNPHAHSSPTYFQHRLQGIMSPARRQQSLDLDIDERGEDDKAENITLDEIDNTISQSYTGGGKRTMIFPIRNLSSVRR